MTLQRKFAVLIGLLSLTAAVSLGGAIWSVDLLNREVAAPFTATTRLLRDTRSAITRLASLRESVASLGELRVRGSERLGEVERGLRMLDEAVGSMGDLDYGAVRLGGRMSRGLIGAQQASVTAVREWMLRLDEGSHGLALQRLDSQRETLELIESQAVQSADLAAGHLDQVRRGILLFQGVAVITAVLAAFLALMLHRRWIVQPVRRLREGAERLAAGELEHRVPERGSDELALLGREVNVMASRVVRMQDEAVERERFAAVGLVVRRVAHNIRNPLAGIRGLAETTRDELVEAGDHGDLQDAQERILTTVDRFDRWLTDFLRASSPNRVAPEDRPARSWLESSVEALRPMAEARRVGLGVDSAGAPERAVFDAPQLEQALVSVTTNAVEATPEGGEVRVSCAGGGGWWELRVEDSGPGIAPEDAARVFEADFTTKPGGHGIGLASARWIVRQHGGMMAVGASPLGGARFTIRLPVDAAAESRGGVNGRGRGRIDGEVDHAERLDS